MQYQNSIKGESKWKDVKEPFVCKNNLKKKDALGIKINVWIDQKTLQKGFFYNYE